MIQDIQLRDYSRGVATSELLISFLIWQSIILTFFKEKSLELRVAANSGGTL